MGKNKYLNRDISWLQFNLRVSDETKKKIPLAEKVMFHGIVFSNLEEFLMVRYPAVFEESIDENDYVGLADAIQDHHNRIMKRFTDLNAKYDIIRKVKDLGDEKRKWAEKYYKQNIFPTLVPVTVDKGTQVNLRSGMYLFVITKDKDKDNTYWNYIEIPHKLQRFIQVPGKQHVIAVETLIKSHIDTLFHQRKIVDVGSFAIMRSSEIYLQSDTYTDPYELIGNTLHEREKSWITCLEISSVNKDLRKAIQKIIPLSENTMVLYSDYIKLKHLKDMPSSVYKGDDQIRSFKATETFPSTDVFSYIKKKDRICFHPFESYRHSVVRFIEAAAADNDVTSIKISLYRVAEGSKIIDALLKAADSGKQVIALIELKARFDEKHNMKISSILREGGVRIIYTKPNIKTHSKVCLVTRQEKKGLRIYSHICTGNYNEANAKIYTDYSYFTADPEIGSDLTQFFNLLTSDQGQFKSKKLVYAPYNMRGEITSMIEREIRHVKKGKEGSIIFKCNSFTDDKIADRLTEAADVGVKVTLIVRSGCIMIPRKNIEVHSIVGRFLEHSRIYIFGTSDDCSIYIGSNDIMQRNLNTRNELMLLIEDKDIRKRIRGHIEMYLKDNINRRVMCKNGYEYEIADTGKKNVYDVHEMFVKEVKKLALSD